LVYNSGGYEKTETLQILEGVFDIYMPDFKFWEKRWAEKYCQAPDYRVKAVLAIKEMHRQVGDLMINAQGVAVKGLLVRHLVMPNNITSTERIMAFLADEVSPETYVNVMDQYRPCGQAQADDLAGRRLISHEFRRALQSAQKAGLRRLDQRTGNRLILR
jgi:putative pyruvate formate lyase activating enzyme